MVIFELGRLVHVFKVSLVVSSGGYETSAIHSKIHSKKIKYAVQSKAILPTIATSKLEQIWKADVVLYPENLRHGGVRVREQDLRSPQV